MSIEVETTWAAAEEKWIELQVLADRPPPHMRIHRPEERPILQADVLLGERDFTLTALRANYRTVLARDPCAYCGARDVRLGWELESSFPGCSHWRWVIVGSHRDHISPRAPGNDVWDNLTATCRSCNSSKGKKPLLLWMAEA